MCRILNIVRKRSLKALYLPDRKRILIDSSEPKLKRRWNESHEIIHDGVPWHQEAMFGDTEITLSPSCHEQIEAEANFGAGRLLFFQNHLREFISFSTPNFALVKAVIRHSRGALKPASGGAVIFWTTEPSVFILTKSQFSLGVPFCTVV